MSTAVFAYQRQLCRRPTGPSPHKTASAGSNRAPERAAIQGVELTPEAGQFGCRVLPDIAMQQTHPHGLRAGRVYSLVGADVQTKAASMYGGWRTE